jgi:hypothetical protein
MKRGQTPLATASMDPRESDNRRRHGHVSMVNIKNTQGLDFGLGAHLVATTQLKEVWQIKDEPNEDRFRPHGYTVLQRATLTERLRSCHCCAEVTEALLVMRFLLQLYSRGWCRSSGDQMDAVLGDRIAGLARQSMSHMTPSTRGYVPAPGKG